jgi:hypothetical protein
MTQPAEPRIVTYTTAPTEYNGFGTRIAQVMGTYNGHIMRRITAPEHHVRWQRDRYGGGLFPPGRSRTGSKSRVKCGSRNNLFLHRAVPR